MITLSTRVLTLKRKKKKTRLTDFYRKMYQQKILKQKIKEVLRTLGGKTDESMDTVRGFTASKKNSCVFSFRTYFQLMSFT